MKRIIRTTDNHIIVKEYKEPMKLSTKIALILSATPLIIAISLACYVDYCEDTANELIATAEATNRQLDHAAQIVTDGLRQQITTEASKEFDSTHKVRKYVSHKKNETILVDTITCQSTHEKWVWDCKPKFKWNDDDEDETICHPVKRTYVDYEYPCVKRHTINWGNDTTWTDGFKNIEEFNRAKSAYIASKTSNLVKRDSIIILDTDTKVNIASYLQSTNIPRVQANPWYWNQRCYWDDWAGGMGILFGVCLIISMLIIDFNKRN